MKISVSKSTFLLSCIYFKYILICDLLFYYHVSLVQYKKSLLTGFYFLSSLLSQPKEGVEHLKKNEFKLLESTIFQFL